MLCQDCFQLMGQVCTFTGQVGIRGRFIPPPHTPSLSPLYLPQTNQEHSSVGIVTQLRYDSRKRNFNVTDVTVLNVVGGKIHLKRNINNDITDTVINHSVFNLSCSFKATKKIDFLNKMARFSDT